MIIFLVVKKASQSERNLALLSVVSYTYAYL